MTTLNVNDKNLVANNDRKKQPEHNSEGGSIFYL